jgi:hypothetical protein
VDQSRLILWTPVCDPDFLSVPPSPLAVVVAAAAARAAVPAAAVDLFYSTFFHTPAQNSARGYFFAFFLKTHVSWF